VVGFYFFCLRRRTWLGRVEPVAVSVRYAAIAQAIVAAAMVRASFGWVETGGRKCAAVAVAA